jgi:hypothetical protein
VRLSDDRKFTAADGGISYQTSLSPQIGQDTLTHEIDCQVSNRSVLVRSPDHNCQHYVLTLRAKPNALAFGSEEVHLLMAAPVICDAIRLSRWLEKQMSDISEVKQQIWPS